MEVAHVLDGDTIRVFINGEIEGVRYASIDAPELDETGGESERAANRELIADGVVLKPNPDGTGRDRDVFDRLLRGIYAPDGTWIEEQLVDGGFATWR